MNRTNKNSEKRKEELIEIALSQFLVNGYEKTSIRSILSEAGGEIGMFYHHFESKEEIYMKALQLFNERYLQLLELKLKDETINFENKLTFIFEAVSNELAKYQQLKTEQVDTEILSKIHRETLLSAIPIFEDLLKMDDQYKNSKLASMNTHFLAEFILFGISAIIHDKTEIDFAIKEKEIKRIISQLLN